MSQDRRSRPSLYSQIDVAHGALGATGSPGAGDATEGVGLLREILAAQDRQNDLLEEMVSHFCSTQRQRANELGNWKQANPGLARSCRLAAEALSKVQTEYLMGLTQEISENFETLRDGEFMLNEFIDRFGPRLAHLNGLLQVLSQLSSTPSPANTPNAP
jgi:chromosome condensin MukBEF ATPase and DNA-binding subunit MukB